MDYLLLVICGYLIFENRYKLKQSIASPSWLFIIPLLGLSISWSLVSIIDIQTIQQTLIPMIFISAVALIFGMKFSLILTPMVLFIYFGIPIWDYIIPLLQNLAIDATKLGLRVLKLPAFIQGITVTVPDGRFQIAGGCSGLRYFLVALTLSTLYGFISYRSIWRTLSLVGFALATALVFNWLRILIIIYVGYATQMQHALVKDHDNFGWVLFAFALIPIFIVARWLESDKGRNSTSPKESKISSHQKLNTSLLTPRHQSETIENTPPKVNLHIIAVIVSALLVFTGPTLLAIINAQENRGNTTFFHFPLFLGDWEFTGPIEKDWVPDYRNANKLVTAIYQKGESKIQISIHHYFSQKQGNELIYYSNNMTDDNWRQIESSSDTMKIDDSLIIPYHALVISPVSPRTPPNHSSLTNKAVMYWYNIAGESTSSRIVAKLLQIKGSLTGRNDAALIALNSNCPQENCLQSKEELVAFGRLFLPYLDRYFTSIR